MARARLENPNGLDLAGNIYLPSVSPRIRRMITVDDDGRLVAIDPFACGTMPGAQYQCALTGLRDENDDPAALNAAGGVLTLNADSNDPFTAVFACGIAAGAVAAHKAELTADETLDASGYADGTYYAYLDYDVATGAVTLAATDRAPLVGFARPSDSDGGYVRRSGRHAANVQEDGKYRTESAPEGYAIASEHANRYGGYNSYYLWRCFDGEIPPSGLWGPVLNWPVAYTYIGNPWIQYVFNEPQNITRIGIGVCRSYPQYFPQSVVIRGSNDGNNWTALTSSVPLVFPSSPVNIVYVDFANTASYLRYKVEFTNVSYTVPSELVFYSPSQVVDVSDWFNPRTMTMRDGDDAQVARVYVGQFEVASGSITSVVTYEYGLRYESDWTALAGGAEVTFTHDLGVEPSEVQILIRSDGRGDSARVTMGEFSRPVRQITAIGTSSWGADVVGMSARQFTVRAGTQGIWVDPTDSEAYIGSGYVKAVARVVW